MYIALLFASIFCAVCGQVLLKFAVTRSGGLDFAGGDPAGVLRRAATNPFLLVGLCVYASSMVLYLGALSKIDISVAYPMVSINYVVILFVSKFVFKEEVNAARWIGVLMICGGVFLISRTM